MTSNHNLIRTVVISLVSGSIALFVAWRILDSQRNFLFDLPHYSNAVPDSFAVSTSEPVEAKTDILWHIQITGEKVNKRIIASITRPWALIDCQHLPNTLCTVQPGGGGIYTVRQWQLIQSTQDILQTVALPFTDAHILALVPYGLFFSRQDSMYGTTEGLYFRSTADASVTTLVESTEGGCNQEVKLSPAGDYLAILCLGKDWLVEAKDPFAPTGQHVYLIKTDGSQQNLIPTPTTYYFNGLGLSIISSLPSSIPDFAWAPDGSEIAFAASFSPPQNYAFYEFHSPFSPYKMGGGIYSVSPADGAIHEWLKVDSQYPLLAWSPDKKYIAYTFSDKDISIVSRDGRNRRIGQLDFFIRTLSWSPDGAYILARGDNQIWVLKTSDYTWQKVELPGVIVDMAWIANSQ